MPRQDLLHELILNKIRPSRAKKIIKEFPRAYLFFVGRHSVILKRGDVCFKVEKDTPAAKNAVNNETKWVRFITKNSSLKICPRLIKHHKKLRVLSYEYVKGTFLPEWLGKEKNKEKIRAVIKKCLKYCRALDELMINKEEMHKPRKHIIINYPRVVFIDFERCYETNKPKNVSQFTSYLLFSQELGLSQLLGLNKELILQRVKDYKHQPTTANFNSLLKEFKA